MIDTATNHRAVLIAAAATLILLMVLALGSLTPSVAKAHSPVLYSISPHSLADSAVADPMLRTINPTTGATISSILITLPGKTVTGGTGLAQDPTTGKLWALLKLAGQSGRELATIYPVTGVATSIGTVNFVSSGDGFANIAFTADGTLYGVTGDGASTSETLFTVNKTNAATTLVLALGNGNDGEAIGFNPDDGLIYHASGNGTQNVNEFFETVNPTTLAVTNVPLSGADYTEALAMVDNGSAFLLSDLAGKLYGVTDAGVVSLIGQMNHRPKGLAFLQHEHPTAVGGETSFLAGGSDSSYNNIAVIAGLAAVVAAIATGGWIARKRWAGDDS